MQVTVKLFATLRDNRFKEKTLEIPDSSRVADLINILDLAHEKIAICFVNGRHADNEQILQNADTVSLFPPIGGG